MARFHIAAALGAATLALLVVLQLLSNFGLPQLEYFGWRFIGPFTSTVPNQFPIHSPDQEIATPENGTLYSLGVGKADITGYALNNRSSCGLLTLKVQTRCGNQHDGLRGSGAGWLRTSAAAIL